MDLKKKLETSHSKALTTAIINYVGHDKARFKALMDLVLGADHTLAQRAAWPLSYIVINHPVLVKPYYQRLIDKLGDKSSHPSLARNILRLFENVEIPAQYQGPLLDYCFAFIRNETVPVAIRAFSITVATRICQPYRELTNELLLLINELTALPQKPAIRVRVREAIKVLQSV